MNATRSLVRAGRSGEQTITQRRTYDASKRLALSVELTEKPTSMLLKGLEFRVEKSDVSGMERVVWGTKPLDLTVPFYAEARPAVSVAPPLAYIIPPQWKDAIEVLEAHGLRLQGVAPPPSKSRISFREVNFAAASSGARAGEFKSETGGAANVTAGRSSCLRTGRIARRAQLLEPEAPTLRRLGFL